jgi:ELWxxDGT repeat protein
VANKPNRRRPLQLQSLEKRNLLAADFELIDTVRVAGLLTEVVATDDAIYFVKDDAQYGKELWRADRDGGNGRLVKDIFAGHQGSNVGSLTVVNRRLFFSANDGVHGQELWTSDGTALNTRMVIDLLPGPASGVRSDLNNRELNTDRGIRGLIFIGDEVFFEGSSDGENTALWASDGTAEGTLLLSPPPSEEAVRSKVEYAFVRGEHILYIQASSSTTFDEKWTLYVGNKSDGFEPYNDISLKPHHHPPLKLLSTLVNGTPFSIGETTYSLTADGKVEKIGDFLPTFYGGERNTLADGHSVFFASARGDSNELYRTDGTASGTEKLDSIGYITKLLLLNRETFVTSPHSSFSHGNLVTLSPKQTVQPIDYTPTAFQIEMRAISETSFLTFELTNAFAATNESQTHLLRIIDIQQKTSRLIFEAASDEAISQILTHEQTLYLTIASKNSFRVAELNLDQAATDPKTIAVFPVTDRFDTVDLKIIGGSLFIEHLSTARTELLTVQSGELRLITTVEVGRPGWQQHYSPRSSTCPPNTIDDRVVEGDAKTFYLKNISNTLTQSPKLSPFFQDYIDLGTSESILGGPWKLQDAFNNDESVFYFTKTAIDGKTRTSLFTADSTGNTTELFSVPTTRTDSEHSATVEPFGTFQGRFYFAAFVNNSWSLFRTTAHRDGVEIASEAIAGPDVYRMRTLRIMRNGIHPSQSTNDCPGRLVIKAASQDNDSRTSKLLEFDFESNGFTTIIEHPVSFGHSLFVNAMLSGDTESIWLWHDVRENIKVEIGQSGVLRDFFTPSQLAELNKPFFLRHNPIRIENAWILFVSSGADDASVWRFSDNSDAAVNLMPFPQSVLPYGAAVLAATKTQVLFQMLGSDDLWSVDNQSDGPTQVKDGATGDNVKIFFRRNFSASTTDPILVGGSDFRGPLSLYTVSESGNALHRLGTLPAHVELAAVVQDGNELLVFGRGSRQGVYRLNRHTVVAPEQDAGSHFSLGSTDDAWIISADTGTIAELDRRSHGTIRFAGPNRPVEFSIDIGVNQSTAFPRGDAVLELAGGSTLKLTGATHSEVVFSVRRDAIEVRIDGRTLVVKSRGSLKIDDQIIASKRVVLLNGTDDDIIVRPDIDGRTQLFESNRDLTIAFPDQPLPTSVNADAVMALSIHTGSGIDRVRVSPSIKGPWRLEITNNLDAASQLALGLTRVLEPPKRESANGRTYQTLILGSLQLRAEITNRPRHNLVNPADTDGNGSVHPIDALRIINFISRRNRGASDARAPLYGDANGDSEISAIDALIVINEIARRARSPEAEPAFFPIASTSRLATDTVFAGDASFYPTDLNQNAF